MTDTQRPTPLLVVALDAAEGELIERWAQDGSLPNLKRLLGGGSFARLDSTAEWLGGSPWASFYTGTHPGHHGLYHYLTWRPEKMHAERPTHDWLPLTPFWRTFEPEGPRVLAVDMPLAYPPEPYSGVEVCGWATHDTMGPPAAHPPQLMDWVSAHFGPPPRSEEKYGLLPPRDLLEIRDALIETTGRVADLAAALMRQERWDVALVGFGATHRGGHKLWDHTGTLGEPTPQEAEALADALRQVYQACDAAIGRLVEAAGEGATVLVFSVHGMGPNTCRTEVLPEMLRRVLAGGPPQEDQSQKPSLLKRLRGLVPESWRHRIKPLLPQRLQDGLTAYWRIGRVDWSRTPAFSLVADLQGYLRVNLRGREAQGIVEPGEEYERLLAEVAEGLGTYVDADSGRPLVAETARADRLYPGAPKLDLLPDLIVHWNDEPAYTHRRIVSQRYGEIPWPTPGRHPEGRSGNHRPDGFLLAVGPGFPAGERLEGGHILDLAPTICDLLEVAPPPQMHGRSLLQRDSA